MYHTCPGALGVLLVGADWGGTAQMGTRALLARLGVVFRTRSRLLLNKQRQFPRA